jgi:hypothetical protein
MFNFSVITLFNRGIIEIAVRIAAVMPIICVVSVLYLYALFLLLDQTKIKTVRNNYDRHIKNGSTT